MSPRRKPSGDVATHRAACTAPLRIAELAKKGSYFVSVAEASLGPGMAVRQRAGGIAEAISPMLTA